jgi:hypothetical protein
VAGEEPDRHRLQVRVDALPQVLQRALPHPADQVGLRVARAPVDERRDDVHPHDQVEGAQVVRADAFVDGQAGQVGRSEPRRRGGGQRQEHHHHPAPVRAKQPEEPAQLPRPLALPPQQPPQIAEEKERPHEPTRLIRLILGLLGDLRPLGLRIAVGDRVLDHRTLLRATTVWCRGPPPPPAVRGFAHRRASSSRRSRSRCRKTASSSPCSAISA